VAELQAAVFQIHVLFLLDTEPGLISQIHLQLSGGEAEATSRCGSRLPPLSGWRLRVCKGE
jgi:hypothetical protein